MLSANRVIKYLQIDKPRKFSVTSFIGSYLDIKFDVKGRDNDCDFADSSKKHYVTWVRLLDKVNKDYQILVLKKK